MSDLEDQPKPELQLQKRWFTPLMSKKVPPVPTDEERTFFPEKRTNWVSQMMFFWLTPIFLVGYKRTIQPNDLWKIDEAQSLDVMYDQFKADLDTGLEKDRDSHVAQKCKERGETAESSSVPREDDLEDFKLPKRTLFKALWKVFWFDYTVGAVMKVLSDAASALAPLLQKKLTNFVSSRHFPGGDPIGDGVGYAIGCCAMIFFSAVTVNFAFYKLQMTGGKVRNVLTRLLLEKSMTIDANGKHKFPASSVNTMMTTDLNRIDFGIGVSSLIISFPVPVTICIVFLIINIGVSALVGIALFIVLFVFLGFSFSRLVNLRKSATKFTDIRVRLIKELLKNFKMIKFYSWESSYQERIEGARNSEMKYILKLQSMRNILIGISVSLPNLSSMAAFLVMYKITDGKSAANVFSSLSLFQVLALQFMLLPMALAAGADTKVGFERISKLLSTNDIDEDQFKILPLDDGKNAIKVVNGCFQWDQFDDEEGKGNDEPEENDKGKQSNITSKKSTEKIELTSTSSSSDNEKSQTAKPFSGLDNINFEIKNGEFVVVTGAIGTGKSSLLAALSGLMKRLHGEVYAASKPLLCGFPWVQNATIRDNITFGLPFDRKKYDDIIECCSLLNDFKQFPGGDMTEVGERGITLSGGQKARINLARAVYANSDIILLDDVLSAVDAKVGKHIVEKCLLGMLSDKTRVLATHQLSLIGAADRMIFMNGDGTIDVGTVEELKLRNDAFVELFKHQKNHEEEEEEEVELLNAQARHEQQVEVTIAKMDTTKDDPNDDGTNNNQMVRIIADEEKAVNAFGWDVYKHYLVSGFGIFGIAFIPLLLTALTLGTFLNFFSNNWLTYWIEQKFDRPLSFYQGLYIMFSFLYVFFICSYMTLLGYFTSIASKKMNIAATRNILKVPMAFMDVSPMGRVLNRFTKDTDVLDNEIVEQFRMATNPMATIVGTFILCIIYLPWFAIAIPIVLFVYVSITAFYQATSREIKRIDAVKRSFVYSHFNETLGGLDTIKAYNRDGSFLKKIDTLMDNQNEAFFLTLAAQRWLGSNLSLITVAFVFCISMLCVFRVFNISAGATGLILTYSMNIPNLLSLSLRAITQIENEFNSVERMNHYAYDLAQEAPHEIPEADPPKEWPQNGAISFKNVNMKYRPELPYVLRNLNLDIKEHEKIGFCGRTGAGKSTFMTCLYRLTEFEGEVVIDGHDISKLGLHALRSKLTIIPQDPVLFVGNIRSNLDPFDEHTDQQLWEALVTADLIKPEELENVKNQKVDDEEELHKFHLLRIVDDDGANFSVGERQLIALARALVRKTKILILDEATSSVDYETDSMIQKTISTEFKDCTILSIAHRLNTILNYDRIVVMDKGEVVQYDNPKALFERTDGIFRQMCDQSGITIDDF